MKIHARFRLGETVRCRMYTLEDGKYVPVEGVRVKLSPVQGEPFGSATPGGSLEMVIANPVAAQEFLDAPLDQEYDAYFSRVEPEEKA